MVGCMETLILSGDLGYHSFQDTLSYSYLFLLKLFGAFSEPSRRLNLFLLWLLLFSGLAFLDASVGRRFLLSLLLLQVHLHCGDLVLQSVELFMQLLILSELSFLPQPHRRLFGIIGCGCQSDGRLVRLSLQEMSLGVASHETGVL